MLLLQRLVIDLAEIAKPATSSEQNPIYSKRASWVRLDLQLNQICATASLECRLTCSISYADLERYPVASGWGVAVVSRPS
jgi:hypothetical protein